MSKYVLVYTGGSQPASEAEGQAVMKAWIDWFTSLGKAVVDAGNPFNGEARRIRSNGQVSNAPDGVPATGYSIIEADSLDVATAMAKSSPQLKSGGEVIVYETFNVM
jgi:hypothetical protein